MKREGKIGSWTLLIWKILKHCTNSGTGTVIILEIQNSFQSCSRTRCKCYWRCRYLCFMLLLTTSNFTSL
jgi:hypothetical protein